MHENKRPLKLYQKTPGNEVILLLVFGRFKVQIHLRKFSTERKIFRGPHAQNFLECICTFTSLSLSLSQLTMNKSNAFFFAMSNEN